MNSKQDFLIGPFTQALTMTGLPPAGPIGDHQLTIIQEAGIHIRNGKIIDVAPLASMDHASAPLLEIPSPSVVIPGLIDAHTHLCFAGSRAADYALRLNGLSYQEIAAQGGGILETVKQTRAASQKDLVSQLLGRLAWQLMLGITTCEIKSGYGLDVENELKMLAAIREAAAEQPISLVPTCLAAHTCPPEFDSHTDYLAYLTRELLPILTKKKWTNRLDIFVDQSGFSPEESHSFLVDAKQKGFSLIIHADQFELGGSLLAAQVGAISADHLECATIYDAQSLKKAGVIPIVLPGASLGLGMPFPPARMLLDAGLPLVIASDWNPGSAPMGNLLTEAAVLGAAQRLTLAETLAALTTRAAKSLNLWDRGEISPGLRADLCIFGCADYREILYYQGSFTPSSVMIEGKIYKEET